MSGKLNYLFISVVFVSVVQIAYFYPYLPEVVASHFGAGGAANGWMGKDLLVILQGVCMVFLLTIFVLADFLKFSRGGRFISLPNRDFWLDDTRKRATELFLRQQTRWFVFYTYLFMLVIFQLVINANLTEEKILAEDQMWYTLLIYGVYIVIWLIRYYRRFAIKSKA